MLSNWRFRNHYPSVSRYHKISILRIQCKVGFRGDGHHCWDINECIEKTHTCVHNAYCYDTDGSFECECETNWILRTGDTECRPDVCPDGYYGHGMYCKQMPDNAECKECFHSPLHGHQESDQFSGPPGPSFGPNVSSLYITKK